MSNSKVDVSDLSNEISKYLDKYVEDIHDQVVEVTEDLTNKAVDELKETSPKGKGKRSTPYWRGWESKIKIKGKQKYHRVIWNKTNYQLTHLLEYGHATRNGGRTKAIPHIEPIEQKYQDEYLKQIVEKIRRVH